MGTMKDPDLVYVYIIGHEDGPQKIGISKDPEFRQTTLGVEGCRKMACQCCLEGFSRQMARRIERHAHMILSDRHLYGEWFDVTVDEAQQAISTAVESAQAGDPLPVVKMKRVTIDLDPDLHLRLKTLVPGAGTTIADLIRGMFSDWADKQEGKAR